MFRKYMHIERLGSDEVKGILNGKCYIFPKLDGTNASLWLEHDGLCAGSRKRKLTLERDNAGFYAWALEHKDDILPYLRGWYEGTHLYGEWLVPHTVRTYRDEAWRKFYLFDIWDGNRYIPYDEWPAWTDDLPAEIIPPIEIIQNPTKDHLVHLLDLNTYLVKDGENTGEGIVIKRYDFVNEWGRTIWAKLVRNEFKERNQKVFGTRNVEMKGKVEYGLANEYVTRGRVEKIIAKMRTDGPLARRRIPELFGRVWHDVINEEMWEIVTQHHRPTIDFGEFYAATIEEVKRNCPELFNQGGTNDGV